MNVDQLRNLFTRSTSLYVLLYLAVVVLFVHLPSFQGLIKPDAMKYAGTARNVARGQGAYVMEIHPLIVSNIRYEKPLPGQYIRSPYSRSFVYPLILAPFLLVFGATDVVVFAVSCMFWILAGWFVFLLGQRLFSKAAGVAAMLIYSAQTKMISFAVAGITEPACAAILLGIALLLLSTKKPLITAVFAGLILLFGMFLRQPMLLLCPVTGFCFLWFKQEKLLHRLAGLAIGGLVAIVIISAIKPWLFPGLPPVDLKPAVLTQPNEIVPQVEPPGFIEEQLRRLFGVSTLQFSNKYPGHALERSTNLHGAFSSDLIGPIFDRLKGNLTQLVSILAAGLGTPLLSLFFIISLVLLRKNAMALRLALVVVLLILGTIAMTLVVLMMPRYYQLLMPFMVPVIGAGAVLIYGHVLKAKGKNAAVTVMVVLFVALGYPGLLTHLISPAHGDIALVELQKDLRASRENTARLLMANSKPEDVIYSDIPWFTGWYGDRKSVWTPLSPQKAEELARWIDVKYLFLSFEDPQGFPNWSKWLRGYREKQESLPLADWKLIDGVIHQRRGMYLFQRPILQLDANPKEESKP